MEEIAKCKMFRSIYENGKGIFGGPHCVEFDVKNSEFHIKIEQCIDREIIVTAKEDVSIFDLFALHSKVERLLMLLDGRFFPLVDIKLTDSSSTSDAKLELHKVNLMANRLSYFASADFCSYEHDKLIEFEAVINSELFERWERLLDELDVVHQMYLYSLSDSKVTVDVKCAFLIELAEPLIEIVKEHTKFFSSLNPGERGTTLKNCIDALITKYGEEIFAREISSAYDKFLTTMVNSRVKIMHIKRRQRGISFNGSESILYTLKMSLLYRRVLFEILGIKEVEYKEKLLKNISGIDKWNDTLDKFLLRLS